MDRKNNSKKYIKQKRKNMALIILPTQDKKIYVQGTSIELPQVYNRIEFGCRPNGTTMEMAFYTYADRAAFETNSSLPTDIPTQNLVVDIDPLTQVQGLEAAHALSKTYYEGLGYQVTVTL
jgi:hypothetical protein